MKVKRREVLRFFYNFRYITEVRFRFLACGVIAAYQLVHPAHAELPKQQTIVWWHSATDRDLSGPTQAFAIQNGYSWINHAAAPIGVVANELTSGNRSMAAQSDAQRVRTAISEAIGAGIAAYQELRFSEAQAALAHAERLVDASGAAYVDASALVDLYIFRGLVASQLGANNAFDEFAVAATLDAARTLDPARFSPRAVEQFTRAQTAVQNRGYVSVTFIHAASCSLTLDGRTLPSSTATQTEQSLRPGTHWLHSTCPGFTTVKQRLAIGTTAQQVKAQGLPLQLPTVDELRIVAQTHAARPFVTVVVAGNDADIRAFNARGLEQKHVTLSLRAQEDGATITAVLTQLITPPARPTRIAWHQRRWVWGVGGAALAAAILTPLWLITADESATATIRPTGLPTW